MRKKLLSWLLVLALLTLCTTGCNGQTPAEISEPDGSVGDSQQLERYNAPIEDITILSITFMTASSPSGTDNSAESDETTSSSGTTPANLLQLAQPPAGSQLMLMKTSMGDITFMLFSDEVPKAVENFVLLAKAGYYDGQNFYRVVKELMILGGDPLGNGHGGQSAWGGYFPGEASPKLWCFSGALAYANGGRDEGGAFRNGSQFFIVEGTSPDELSTMTARQAMVKWGMAEDSANVYAQQLFGPNATTASVQSLLEAWGFPEEVAKAYISMGGYPLFDINSRRGMVDKNYTVFGQVVEGMDVVHAIAAVETQTVRYEYSPAHPEDSAKNTAPVSTPESTSSSASSELSQASSSSASAEEPSSAPPESVESLPPSSQDATSQDEEVLTL